MRDMAGWDSSYPVINEGVVPAMGSADRTLKFKFNPQQTGLTMVLGPLESDIMQVTWRLKRVTVADVHRELQNSSASRRDIAYTTVMTTMSRLAEKNVL